MVTICIRPKTVVLNVSGEKFEIQPEMFNEYPKTILAKEIQKHYKEDNVNDVLFINRCPTLFRFLLQFVRDKKVYLPVGVSKASFLNEMNYYCFDNIEESNIAVGGYPTANGFGHFIDHGQELLKDVQTKLEIHEESILSLEETLEIRKKCLAIAKKCIREKMQGVSKYRDLLFKMSEAESQIVNEYLMDFSIQVQKDYEKNECTIFTIPETKNKVFV